MLNNKVREIVVDFYNLNGQEYENGYEFARALLKLNDKLNIGIEGIAKYYRRLKKGENLLNIEKKKEDSSLEYLGKKEGNATEQILEQKTNKQITSLEEAIEFFEVDLTQWEVTDWKCKAWGTSMKIEEINEGKKSSTPITKTNYLVSISIRKKNVSINYDKIYKELDDWGVKKIKLQKRNGEGVGVLVIADLHTGLKTSKVNGTVNTPEYSISILIDYLQQITQKVNSLNYEKLHVIILGDLVESVTGYNHLETLKEMEYGVTGGNLIIVTYEIIKKFISSLLNVEKVYFISGNHDRLTPDSRMDQEGGAAQIISYMLNQSVSTIWHSMIMNVVIDNISYILTHGHLKLNKQDIGKIVFQYGRQDHYNVILEGHLHHRKTKRAFLKEDQMIVVDTNKYRMITVPSITTGNRWAESMGFGSTGGFTVIESNKSKTNINHLDFSL